MSLKPLNRINPSESPQPIRYEATLRHLRDCLNGHQESRKLIGRELTESQTQQYQAAFRKLLEALIQHVKEIAKLEPQLRRPN